MDSCLRSPALSQVYLYERKTMRSALSGTGSKAFTLLQPGLHISRKDRMDRLENMFFKLSSYGLVSML